MGARCQDLLVTVTYLLLCAVLVAVAQPHQDEVEIQSDFTYNWNSTSGPQNWGRLNPNWTACGIGKLQSPIDLVNGRVLVLPTLGNLIRVHKPAPALVKNRGHDITVQWEGDAGGVIINQTLYKLKQCHWHTPSEHMVNGKKYDMEMHMVHKDVRGQIAVVGILYRLGSADPFLATLLENTRNVSQNGTRMGVLDPMGVRFGSRQYMRYIGSLTTPPCTEGVLWTILQQVKTVSRRQMRALRQAVADGFENNARPVQYYQNPVFMYRPQTQTP